MWKQQLSQLPHQPPAKYRDWMTEPYQLAKALRQVCQRLTLFVLSETWAPPLRWMTSRANAANLALHRAYTYSEEQQCLQATQCYVREIFLQAEGVPVCYARVVVPPIVYYRYREAFSQLGENLIGETMLYCCPSTTRHLFEYSYLPTMYALFGRICYCLTPWPTVTAYWGRRSLFLLAGSDPIVITEFFTNVIPDWGD